jgi:hypothetical protein
VPIGARELVVPASFWRVVRCRSLEPESADLYDPRDQQHVSRHALRLSLTAITAMASAASGSAHHQPSIRALGPTSDQSVQCALLTDPPFAPARYPDKARNQFARRGLAQTSSHGVGVTKMNVPDAVTTTLPVQ